MKQATVPKPSQEEGPTTTSEYVIGRDKHGHTMINGCVTMSLARSIVSNRWDATHDQRFKEAHGRNPNAADRLPVYLEFKPDFKSGAGRQNRWTDEQLIAMYREYARLLAARPVGGNSYRTRVLKRDDNRCVVCNVHKHVAQVVLSQGFRAAHIVARRDIEGHKYGQPKRGDVDKAYYDPDNGFAMCATCETAYDNAYFIILPDGRIKLGPVGTKYAPGTGTFDKEIRWGYKLTEGQKKYLREHNKWAERVWEEQREAMRSCD